MSQLVGTLGPQLFLRHEGPYCAVCSIPHVFWTHRARSAQFSHSARRAHPHFSAPLTPVCGCMYHSTYSSVARTLRILRVPSQRGILRSHSEAVNFPLRYGMTLSAFFRKRLALVSSLITTTTPFIIHISRMCARARTHTLFHAHQGHVSCCIFKDVIRKRLHASATGLSWGRGVSTRGGRRKRSERSSFPLFSPGTSCEGAPSASAAHNSFGEPGTGSSREWGSQCRGNWN